MAAIWKDVLDTRAEADAKIEQTRVLLNRDPQDQLGDEEMVTAILNVVDAFRLEIRALGQNISYAIGEASDARR